MNTIAHVVDANLRTRGDTLPTQAASDACFHCGEALPAAPARLSLEGTMRMFCCAGCAASAQWIRDADLVAYYRLRSEPAAKVGIDHVDLALWDREEVLAEHARAVPGGRELTLLTDGMRCAACAWLIDRALGGAPGVLEVSANAITGRIRIAWNPARTQLSAVLQRLVALGYRPFLANGGAVERARRSERNRWLLRLGIAGLGAMQAMMFAEASYLDTAGTMPIPTRDFLRWVTFLVATPVVFYAGWPFLSGAWRELRHRAAGMDVLVATAVLSAYAGSVVAMLRGAAQVWYDAAVMFVFLLLAARVLEQRVRAVATAQVDALARARPVFATRERHDGSRECVPANALVVGDVACVAAGEAVPADGELLDAEASFEESLLTGESHPVHKRAGAMVYAGTLSRERPARLRVAATGAATRLSQLARLVERAQAHRPSLARAADRVAGWFVLALLGLAVATWAVWHFHDPSRAFEITLALLVVSCPCALSLSVPAALAAANGTLARSGMLPVRADALDRLARISDVVFDKTGTLSTGRPALADVATFGRLDRAQALRIAAALERDSTHPLATAFADASAPAATDVVAAPGQGIEGWLEGRRWRLGQAPFACCDRDDGAIWLGDGSRAMARFTVTEQARMDVRESVATLEGLGLGLHLWSGDGDVAVARFAAPLGLPDAQSRQSPEDKLARVRELQALGRVVAMVGDGLNDAPVLAGADVSIAIGEGAALAQRSADLVLTSGSLLTVPAAIGLARRTRRVIRQNLGWAIGYNLLALPLAATGQVTPWLAALAMAVSSLTVTLNALRLTRRVVP